MTAAGNFRERVTFRRLASAGQTTPSDATDEYGNPIDALGNSEGTFADHLPVWADMLEATGREKLAGGAMDAPRMATVRVRASAATRGLTTADVLRARGQDWNIRGIAEIGRKGEILELMVEAGVAI